jgi:hypothetical protein
MRALFFARDNVDFDVAKAAFFQKLVQAHFAKAEPLIGIKFSRLFETMTEQVQHDDAAVFFQDAIRRPDRTLRLDRVMQRLASDGKIDAVPGNRRVLDIAQPVLEILHAMLFRQLRAELNHPGRVIDCNNFAGALRE